MSNLARLIDHTNLKQDTKKSDIITLSEEAVKLGFASICVNPVHIEIACSVLKDETPKVGTVIGFPLGADSAEMKYAEARYLIHQGAEELDMVVNIGALKQRETNILSKEIGRVVDAADGHCVKVIIETCLLTKEEKILASTIAKDQGADFVKTSTGFSTGGATIDDIRLIRETVGKEMSIKASGGIRTLLDIESMVEAGANRIGASNGVQIFS